MNVGDTIIDTQNKHWLVIDFVSYESEDLICVTDLKTQTERDILRRDEVQQLVKKPSNVSYLLIKRRDVDEDLNIAKEFAERGV